MSKIRKMKISKDFISLDKFFHFTKFLSFIQKNQWKKMVSILTTFWNKETRKKFLKKEKFSMTRFSKKSIKKKRSSQVTGMMI